MKIILGVDPVKFPLTGIGRYTYELAKSLSGEASILQLLFFHGMRLRSDLPQPLETAGRLGGIKPFLARNRLVVALHRLWGSHLKRRALRQFGEHIFHGPNYYVPPFPGRSVATMHDLSVYTWASCHPPERVRYLRREIELTLKRATALIVDSQYTRREVSTFFGWPLDRIFTAHLASGPEFFPRDPASIAPQLARYGLEAGKYSLFVGSIEPRKNIEGLLDAFSSVPTALQQRFPLVLAGYRGWENDGIHRRLQRLQRLGTVRYLGFVPSGDLPVLYSGARLFIFPSHYEGFGLPVLEAMASGVPVVCSNTSSLPEVAGDAAAMCGADDMSALRLLIEAGLEDTVWREQAISKGLQQAAGFSWKRCARETVAAYRAVSGF
jgi:alpha-1,3-rhamnosyl/mannosyltransferase